MKSYAGLSSVGGRHSAPIRGTGQRPWPRRKELLTDGMLRTAGVWPDRKVLDLSHRFRRRECDERGRAVVSVGGGGEDALPGR